MNKHVIVHLAGPSMAWGSHEFGWYRATEKFPLHSHICGMLGAALGIDRMDFDSQKELRDSFIYAVKLEGDTQSEMTDFQTLRPTIKRSDYRIFRGVTRSSFGNMVNDKNGIVKKKYDSGKMIRKNYICDSKYIALIRLKESSKYIEEDLIYALGNPVYTTCLGRKNCIPSEPLIQKESIVEADSFLEAFKEVSKTSGTVWTSEESEEAYRKVIVRDFPNFDKLRTYSKREIYEIAV